MDTKKFKKYILINWILFFSILFLEIWLDYKFQIFRLTSKNNFQLVSILLFAVPMVLLIYLSLKIKNIGKRIAFVGINIFLGYLLAAVIWTIYAIEFGIDTW